MERFSDDPWPMWQHRNQAALFVIAASSGVHVGQTGGNARHGATKRPGCRSKTILNMLTKGIAEAETARVNIDDHDISLLKMLAGA